MGSKRTWGERNGEINSNQGRLRKTTGKCLQGWGGIMNVFSETSYYSPNNGPDTLSSHYILTYIVFCKLFFCTWDCYDLLPCLFLYITDFIPVPKYYIYKMPKIYNLTIRQIVSFIEL